MSAFKLLPTVVKMMTAAWMPAGLQAILVKGTEIVSDKAAEYLLARKAARQIEAIAENVTTTLAEHLDGEFKKFDEQEQEQLRSAVEDVIFATPIDVKLIAERNFNPEAISAHVIGNSRKALAMLDERVAAATQKIVSETVRYVVEVAADLPHFTEKVSAEILRRESYLIDIANTCLAEIKKVSDLVSKTEGDESIAAFESAYRLSVARKLDELELYGVDLPSYAKKRKLSVAYISLNVQKAEKQRLPELGGANSLVTADGAQQFSIETLLSGSSRILIRGQAGSGKTTLLQWLAVNAALKNLSGSLSTWNGVVPFWITLRSFANMDLPTPDVFAKLINPILAETAPEAWARGHLSAGTAIVLIDGIDELQESRRPFVKEWLQSLVEAYPKARYFVTSRPAAVSQSWLAHLGFIEAELQPMDLVDIMNFIDHWHRAALSEPGAEPTGTEDDYASRLKVTIRHSRPLRSLATNPLLCAMLCAMARARHSNMPTDRIELYDACCHMLTERRDNERAIVMSDYPTLTHRQQMALLKDVAYWMLRNGESEVDVSALTNRVSQKLPSISGLPAQATAAGIVKLFVERSGLTRCPSVGKFDFTHNSFKEFLAAQAINDEKDYGVIERNANDDQWRDVIVLAAGHASPKEREDIITRLLRKGNTEAGNRHKLHLLAVACLETSVDLKPELQSEMNRSLRRVVPPRNMSDARALVAAGELAIPFLKRKSQRETATTTAAIVRTLGWIGSPLALEALEGYGTDARMTVANELLRAWTEFDRRDYAERVLQKRKNVVISRLKSLDGFEFLRNLEILTAYDCTNITNLKPLMGLGGMRILSLQVAPSLSDISSLSALEQLRKCEVGAAHCLTDAEFDALGGCASLTDLRVFGANLRSAEWASRLKSLVRLEIGDSTLLEDLDGLSRLTNLRTLNIYQLGIKDFEFLRNMKSLRHLNVYNCQKLTDSSAIESLTHLRTCSVRGCGATRDINFRK